MAAASIICNSNFCSTPCINTSPICCAECICDSCHQPCRASSSPSIIPTTNSAAAAVAPSSVYSDPTPLFQQMLLDERLLRRIADESLAYAMSNGITMLKPPPASTPDQPPTIMHAPVTLLPYRMNESIYNNLKTLSLDYNTLYERVSRDLDFLRNTLRSSGELDPFVRRLLQVLEVAHGDSASSNRPYKKQNIQLSINRSDYLMHYESETDLVPKQVEFNTISAGAGSLSHKVCDMHQFLIQRYIETNNTKLQLPSNPVIRNITDSMAHAHRLFLEQQRALHTSAAIPHASILFIVQNVEANMADQRMLEYELWKNHHLSVVRMTLGELQNNSFVDPNTGLLYVRSPLSQGHHQSSSNISATAAAVSSSSPSWSEDDKSNASLISLCYFRAAYTPRDFPTQADGSEANEWSVLERLETSVAIKCPSIAYHLSGTKKIQQVLSLPRMLEKFFPSPSEQPTVARIRRSFVDLWEPSTESVARVLANPTNYVLKPQREGGGNNLWGHEMIRELTTNSVEELQKYIIMERIHTDPPMTSMEEEAASTSHSDVSASSHSVSPLPPNRSLPMRQSPALKFGKLVMVEKALSELGLMGSVISQFHDDHSHSSPSFCDRSNPCSLACAPSPPSPSQALQIHRNEYVGYLLRTKDANMNEGGLMSGAGAVDSLVLIP